VCHLFTLHVGKSSAFAVKRLSATGGPFTRIASCGSLFSPSFPSHTPMKSPLKAAIRVQDRVEDWFWRFVAVGVICDFLYVSWVLVKSFRGQ
jgi:hypothetical protein